jgi:hypothetical protein
LQSSDVFEREREEEVEARIGSSGGVLFYGVEGAFL